MNQVKSECTKSYRLAGSVWEIPVEDQNLDRIHLREYDSYGNLTKEVFQVDRTKEFNEKIFENQYDNRGRLISVKTLQEQEIVEQTLFFYQADKPYMEITIGKDEIEKEVFDNQGNILQYEYYSFGAENTANISDYQYDSNHQIRSVSRFRNGFLTDSENYQYDANGKLIRYENNCKSGEKELKLYFYQQEQKTFRLTEILEKEAFTKFCLYFFKKEDDIVECIEYQGNNIVRKTVFKNVSDDEETNESEYFLESIYYDNNLITSSIVQLFDDENRLIFRKYIEKNGDYYQNAYRYHENGNLLERQSAAYNSDGQMISTELIEKYIEAYDQLGNLTQQRRIKADGVTTFMEETQLEYYPSEAKTFPYCIDFRKINTL